MVAARFFLLKNGDKLIAVSIKTVVLSNNY